MVAAATIGAMARQRAAIVRCMSVLRCPSNDSGSRLPVNPRTARRRCQCCNDIGRLMAIMRAAKTAHPAGYPQSRCRAGGRIPPMSSTRFVHLRLHSEFSVVDGIVRIDDAVRKAARDGQGALALTDSANVFGAVRFYAAARRKGVKPIVGCDLWITNEADRDNPFRLAVLVQDRRGYLNLCDLLTRAYLENQHRNRAEV